MAVVKYHGPNKLVFTFNTDDPRPYSVAAFRRLVRNGTLEVVDGDVADLDDAQESGVDDNDVTPADGEVEQTSKDDLLDLADELGVDVDRRWGAARIQQAIDDAQDG